MRILVVVPHYFGSSDPELPIYGSGVEPLGRIAAFSDVIAALHGNFGPRRYSLSGEPIAADAGGAERVLDIVVLTHPGHELIEDLGLAPGILDVQYVDCPPLMIEFEAQRVMRERLGRYDFYCLLEDDLIIRDPAFFEKLRWFQSHFGPEALLMPVRVEIPATGTPAKVVIDPHLEERDYAPFRRPGQRPSLQAEWNRRLQTFALPPNPHAGSYFLSAEQLAHWVRQPTFGDADTSWVGPLESAATLSVGRVFDLYKPTAPDPFFLELLHFGTRYASRVPNVRHGEPPLLAIAQNALKAAMGAGATFDNGDAGRSFRRVMRQWVENGTALEQRGSLETGLADARAHGAELEARARSPRWLLASLRTVLLDRLMRVLGRR